MPQLRDVVDKMLIRMDELTVISGQIPLEQYYDKYLKLNKTFNLVYRVLSESHRDLQVRRKVAIIVALHSKNFFMNNICLSELESQDSTMTSLKNDYDIYYSRNKDKTLSNELTRLFRKAKWYYSIRALVELAQNNDFPLKDPKYIAKFYDKPKKNEAWLRGQRQTVNKRFDELLTEGMPDEK